MRKYLMYALVSACAACSPPVNPDAPIHTDSVRAAIIQESIDKYQKYHNTCPCPYTIKDDRPCDRNSAYSNGYKSAPICYPKNVTDEMITEYKNRR